MSTGIRFSISFLLLLFAFAEGTQKHKISECPAIFQDFHHCHKKSMCTDDSSSITSGFQNIFHPDGNPRLGIIGDVNDVLQGRVTPSVNRITWSQGNTGPFGFGASAIGPLSGLGEAIYVNGIAFVRSTDNGTSNYFKTVTDKKFKTSFSLFVQRDAKASLVTRFSGSPELPTVSFSNIYERIHRSIGHIPFCFHGLANFNVLEAIAISKAPIYNEPLFGAIANGYYTKPSFRIPNLFGFVFGCAANFSTVRDPQLRTTLGKLLYLNPMDASAANQLQIHSHVLSLNRCLSQPNQIQSNDAQDVFHLLSNASVNYFQFSVFPFERNQNLEELVVNGKPKKRATSSSPISTLARTDDRIYSMFLISYLVAIMIAHTI